MSQTPQLIDLALIRLDEEVWPRSGFDHDRVDDFAALFEAGGLEALPPVVIVHDGAGRYLVCDGHHRVAALYQVAAQTALTVTQPLPDGRSPEQFAFEYGVETAAHAAKPLSRIERNAAVDRLLVERPDWSDRAIAQLCGVSHQTVGRRRGNGSSGPAPADVAHRVGGFRRVGELDAASRLFRALEKVREARGLGIGDFFAGRDRTGERLASVLADAFGESALERAREYQTWIASAIAGLSGGGPQ
jgi:hypothetical protein